MLAQARWVEWMRVQLIVTRGTEVMPHNSVKSQDCTPNVETWVIDGCTAVPARKFRVVASIGDDQRISGEMNDGQR